jgi:hypothetical protein
MSLFIDKVEILSLQATLYGKRDLEANYYFGELTLKCEGREYILTTVQTYWDEEGGFSTIQIDLEKDEDTFSTCSYDLKAADFISKNLEAGFYLGIPHSSNEVKDIMLFIKNRGMIQVINLNQE